MKAIVNTAVGVLAMRKVPRPEPAAGQVRVQTSACGICATDLEMIDGDPRTPYPAILGHEWTGVVEAVGAGVDVGLLGRRCVAENVWPDGSEVGFEHAGGYGEYLVTESACVRTLPDDVPAEAAALIEPLAVCVRAMHRLEPHDLAGAVVFGDGPIGLILVALLRRAGMERILLVGGREGRLALGGMLGAGETLNYHEAADGLAEAVADAAGARANVIEASGSPSAMAAAMACAAAQGRVLVLGDYGAARADFAWNDLLHREVRLIGSNASAGAWDEAVRLAVGGEVDLGLLVTHRMPARRFAEGMRLVRGRGGDVVKVVLTWE